VDGYLDLGLIAQGELVSLSFPLITREAEETVSGQTYQVRWRGDTVVGIEPRGTRYPLYERTWMENDVPPMISPPPFTNQHGGPVHW